VSRLENEVADEVYERLVATPVIALTKQQPTRGSSIMNPLAPRASVDCFVTDILSEGSTDRDDYPAQYVFRIPAAMITAVEEGEAKELSLTETWGQLTMADVAGLMKLLQRTKRSGEIRCRLVFSSLVKEGK